MLQLAYTLGTTAVSHVQWFSWKHDLVGIKGATRTVSLWCVGHQLHVPSVFQYWL